MTSWQDFMLHYAVEIKHTVSSTFILDRTCTSSVSVVLDAFTGTIKSGCPHQIRRPTLYHPLWYFMAVLPSSLFTSFSNSWATKTRHSTILKRILLSHVSCLNHWKNYKTWFNWYGNLICNHFDRNSAIIHNHFLHFSYISGHQLLTIWSVLVTRHLQSYHNRLRYVYTTCELLLYSW